MNYFLHVVRLLEFKSIFRDSTSNPCCPHSSCSSKGALRRQYQHHLGASYWIRKQALTTFRQGSTLMFEKFWYSLCIAAIYSQVGSFLRKDRKWFLSLASLDFISCSSKFIFWSAASVWKFLATNNRIWGKSISCNRKSKTLSWRLLIQSSPPYVHGTVPTIWPLSLGCSSLFIKQIHHLQISWSHWEEKRTILCFVE